MRLYDLDLYDFRNYHRLKVALNEGVNFFVGDNGSGKTNLLEAIYFLALAKSYKTTDINLIRYEREFSRINARFDVDGKINSAKMVISQAGKKIIYNGIEMIKLSDYIGKLNVLSFLPEDITLIKGSPRDRRYYIDMVMGQIDRNYLLELTNYKKLVRQRNEILKGLSETKKYDYDLLDVVTEQVAESAEKIVELRKRFVAKINYHLNSTYSRISGSKQIFKFEYSPSIDADFLGFLKSKYKSDILMRMTVYGPHRDDYVFEIDRTYARDVSSQGEQRVMIISLILAISEIIYQIKNERPVLLLDDVFSELDTLRQNHLVDYISKTAMQVIITTTNLNEIKDKILSKSTIFIVKDNAIEEDTKIG